MGLYKFADGKAPRMVFYRYSKRVCWLDELTPGTRIQLTSNDSGGSRAKVGRPPRGGKVRDERVVNFDRTPVATILSLTNVEGKFRVKLDHGGFMLIDLRNEPFELIRDKPRVTLLDDFSKQKPLDISSRFDYEKDQRQPSTSDYEENFFHEKRVANVERKKKASEMSDAERFKAQQAMLKSQLSKSAAEKERQAEIQAAVDAERKAKEEAEAERLEYERELAEQKAQLAAKRAEQEAKLAAL
jgi:hypothetical protein